LHAYKANKTAAPATTTPAPFKAKLKCAALPAKVVDAVAAEGVAEPNEKGAPVLLPLAVVVGPKLNPLLAEDEAGAPVPLPKLNTPVLEAEPVPVPVAKLNAPLSVDVDAVLVMVVAGDVVLLPDALPVAVVVATPEEPEEPEQLLFARQENWVEYWNSPVPSTMTSMPYPVSVLWVPAARSQGTFQV